MNATDKVIIATKGLTKQYGDLLVLDHIDEVIYEGEKVAVIGPSGSGKSTFLRCLNCMEDPTEGAIYFDGVDIADMKVNINTHREHIGMVFQQFNLFNNKTVLQNIMLAPVYVGKRELRKTKWKNFCIKVSNVFSKNKKEFLPETTNAAIIEAAEKKAYELLRKIGLEEKADKYPSTLSGGQKQRIAIVRALAMNPEIMLFDEPTSALDPTMIGEVQAVIRDLAKDGTTMIIVTHEMKFAREICNRVFYMDQGGVYEDGPPEQIFDNPQKERTRQFIRHLKVLEYSITSKDFDFIGFNTQIEEFGRKHRVSQRTIYNIQSYIEEMCVQIILPQMKDLFELLVTIEYSEDKDDADVVIRYGGAAFDPTQTDNDLSLLLAKKATESITYSFDPEQSLCNRVDAQIH